MISIFFAIHKPDYRDAASRQTGIEAFTDSIKTHKRWTITHSTRGAIVGKLLVKAGLSNREEVSLICHSDECQIGSFSSEATI